MQRHERKREEPDIGVLAARLLFAVQRELFERLAELGFADARPRHGAVLAYLDPEGTRLSELTRLSGRRKQTLGAIIDDLERLGYLERRPDPADRRALLVVPTERGRRFIDASDAIVGEIEAGHAVMTGSARYAALKRELTSLTRGD